ncbi:MAG: hypothetical protein ACLQIQ_05855 [Beijerinckiaceae bacterium]
MDIILARPFSPILALCAGAGLVLGFLTRLTRLELAANSSAPAIFLLAYYLTYQKVPDFPPLGATNKIFYIALFATAFGAMFDLIVRQSRFRPARLAAQGLAAALVSFTAAYWIAQARFAKFDAAFAAAFIGLGLGGAFVLWALQAVADAELPGADPDRVESRSDLDNGKFGSTSINRSMSSSEKSINFSGTCSGVGPFVTTALLAVLPAAFAPLALFGASSTSVGLCLGLMAGFAVLAVVALYAPRPVGATAILGAGGGLSAVIFTVAFISKRIDYLVLPLLLAVPFFGQVGARLAALTGRCTPWRVGISIAFLAVALIALIGGSLLLRHDNPLGA